jgi:hypothetical protein
MIKANAVAVVNDIPNTPSAPTNRIQYSPRESIVTELAIELKMRGITKALKPKCATVLTALGGKRGAFRGSEEFCAEIVDSD